MSLIADRMSRLPALIVSLALLAAATACASDGDDDKRRALPALQEQLNTSPHPLELCVTVQENGLGGHDTTRRRRQGRKQLAALIRAHQQDPGALVTVEYLSDGARKRKDITISRLARRELHSFKLPFDNASDRSCIRAAHRRLSEAVSGRAKPRRTF